MDADGSGTYEAGTADEDGPGALTSVVTDVTVLTTVEEVLTVFRVFTLSSNS